MVQARQEACRSTAEDSKPLIPEEAWPLMDVDAAGRGAARADSTRSGTFSFPAMASGGAQAVPTSDCDTDCDTSVSDCDTVLASSDDEADEMQKLSHMAVAIAEALEDDHQKLRAYTAGLYAMGCCRSCSYPYP